MTMGPQGRNATLETCMDGKADRRPDRPLTAGLRDDQRFGFERARCPKNSPACFRPVRVIQASRKRSLRV